MRITMVENIKKTPTQAVKLSEVFMLTLKRWPWLVASVAVCVGLALFYVLRTQPTYTRTAQVVLRNDSNGNSMSGFSEFIDFGLIETNTNLLDEVNKFQSPDLMAQVVERLDLTMNYSSPGRFHRNILYGKDLPVTVSLPAVTAGQSASMTLDIATDGKIEISDMTLDGEEVALSTTTAAFGDTVKTPAGPMVVSKTPYYKGDGDLTLYVSKSTLEGAVNKYQSEVLVELQDEKSNTISITANDHSAQRAEDVINNMIDVYNAKWVENRNIISSATTKFINDRLAIIEQELDNVDQSKSNFQSQNMIPDVEQAASMYMSENQAANKQILELNNQLQMTRYMRAYLNDNANRNSVLPANSGIGNPNIEKQIADYNTTILKRNQLAAGSTSSHPLVQDLESQLAQMRSAILSAVDNQIVALDTQMRNLQNNRSQTAAEIAANPKKAADLLPIERQQKVKEALYLFLLQKREETQLTQAFSAYNTDVIVKPTGSDRPSSPKKSRILMIAFALGLLIPFGVTYIRESNNTKVRSRKDLESLSIPMIGEIPLDKSVKSSKDQTPVVVHHGVRNVINEAFRVMRSNLTFLNKNQNQGTQTIMVSSFNAGSGKTFATINLATALAIKGSRVLVIDGDMRHASASKYAGTPSHGLSNYLVGNTDDVDSLIVKNVTTDNMDILPVGAVPPNPTELLESDRMGQLLDSLKGQYDYIFIDCPPVEMLADAQIINKLCDRTIFVVRADMMDRDMVPELKKLYDEKRYVNLCMILNGTTASNSRYGYGYGAYSYFKD